MVSVCSVLRCLLSVIMENLVSLNLPPCPENYINLLIENLIQRYFIVRVVYLCVL